MPTKFTETFNVTWVLRFFCQLHKDLAWSSSMIKMYHAFYLQEGLISVENIHKIKGIIFLSQLYWSVFLPSISCKNVLVLCFAQSTLHAHFSYICCDNSSLSSNCILCTRNRHLIIFVSQCFLQQWYHGINRSFDDSTSLIVPVTGLQRTGPLLMLIRR
jgi:hypothetical protein